MDGRVATHRRQLLAHPAGAASAATAATVLVAASPDADGGLLLDYRLELVAGARVVTAARGDSLPADRLWAYTCFEAFIARADSPAYREYNFSPSGQWAAWDFSGYRQRADLTSLPPSPPPTLDWQYSAASGEGPAALCLRALLPAAALPPGDGEVRLGLSAVLLSAGGETAYLALHHPCARPDFHDRQGFTLRLTLPA